VIIAAYSANGTPKKETRRREFLPFSLLSLSFSIDDDKDFDFFSVVEGKKNRLLNLPLPTRATHPQGTMAFSSSARRATLSCCVLALAAAATAAAVDPVAAAVASVFPDPSPSLKSAGDTLYTTLKSNATNATFWPGSNNGTSVIKSE